MNLLFLGTGTSYGVPMIGCHCAVCQSDDPRDKRRRAALQVDTEGVRILIDTPPDLRESSLLHGAEAPDIVAITHAHADHIFGFDDLRAWCRWRSTALPVLASAGTAGDLQRTFPYAFGQVEIPEGTTVPTIDLKIWKKKYRIGSVTLRPIPVEHGHVETHGVLIETPTRRLAYIPDCFTIPQESMKLLRQCDAIILDALKEAEHTTHLNFQQSSDLLQELAPRRSWVTHLCHEVSHIQAEALLKPGQAVAFDGLRVTL